MKINSHLLGGVTETLLFTLYMRYRESIRPDSMLPDKRYGDLVDSIDFDFSAFDEIPEDMQLSIVCRTLIFDTLTRRFIEIHPEDTVVSLGSGLDFRHERLDNGKILWVDIDVPEVVDLRKVFFPETTRHYSIASSILDFSWMESIPGNRTVLFIAEGLLMYLAPHEVQTTLSNLSHNFRESEMILDVCNNWYLNAAKNSTPYSFLKRMYSLWKWGMDDWREIEAFDPGIHFIEEYYQYYGFGDRMPQGLKNALNSVGERRPQGLKDALFDEDAYWEREQEVTRTMSRIGHISLGS
jgi:O-methyltransferase involved in polyketide biosynthesis